MRGWSLADGAYLGLVMRDGTRFLVEARGAEVWVDAPTATADQVGAYLLGPILSVALRRRRVVCLHASAVSLSGRAVVFAGPEGAGKSTLAAAFAMRGCAVVTDDLAALARGAEGMALVHPGAAFLRVRPGVVADLARVCGRARDLRRSPDRAYLDLDLAQPGYGVASSPRPVDGVYFLDRPGESGAMSLEPMSGSEAVMALVSDTWATRLLDRRERAAELDELVRLVNRVPMVRVRRAGGLTSLSRLVDLITLRSASQVGAGEVG
jgi:hypothetical protein